MRGRPLTVADRPRIVDLFTSGETIEKISQRLETRAANVVRALRLAGIEVKTRKSPLSQTEKEAALAMYTPEIGVSETARRLGLSRSLVDKLLKSQGIRVISNSETRAIPKEDKEKLEKLYWEEGWTAEEIGRLYNTHSNVVTKFFRKNGVKARNQSESVTFLGLRVEREIVDAYLAGDGLAALARRFSRGEKVIRDKLTEKGVYVPPVPPTPLNDEFRAAAHRMYVEEEMTIAQIVDALPIHRAELTQYLISIKISRKDRKFTPELRDEIREMYTTSNQSIKYICRLLSCSPHIVREILTERNIPIRESVEQIFKWNHKNAFLSGTYRGVSFRSSVELSFLIGYIERFETPYESGECKEWSVPYVDPKGKSRTYYPDFVLTGRKMVIEIKPKCFWSNPVIQAKKRAAEARFGAMGFKYRLVAYPVLYDEIIERYLKGEVVFHDDHKFRSHMLVQRDVNIDRLSSKTSQS